MTALNLHSARKSQRQARRGLLGRSFQRKLLIRVEAGGGGGGQKKPEPLLRMDKAPDQEPAFATALSLRSWTLASADAEN